jgi:hypothetical protein
MIYFYLWVLFLVSVSLALPIVAFVEKSRARKEVAETMGATEPTDEAFAFDEAEEELVAAEDEMAGFGEAVSADPDDFSAFDDFK